MFSSFFKRAPAPAKTIIPTQVIPAMFTANSMNSMNSMNSSQSQSSSSSNSIQSIQSKSPQYSFTDETFVKNLAKTLEPNVVFSPLSITFILSVLQLAARGESLKQIASVLKREANDNELFFIKNCFNNDIITLCNMMLVNNKSSINKDFVKKVSTVAEIKSIDFSNGKNVANLANNYIETNTKGLIKNVLSKDQITSSSILVLINCIYFKAQWKKAFKKELITKKFFNNNKEVDMMMITKVFDYGENDYCQVVELPYKDEEFVMGFILKKIPGTNSSIMPSIMNKTRVQVSIPKFTHRSKLDLIPTMKELGLINIFDAGKSELDLAANTTYVSTLIHEVVVIVDHIGTEAAAVTVVVCDNESLFVKTKPDPIIFNANRTFDYYIKHKSSVIIFSGNFTGGN